MKKEYVITIGRQLGSGGREIGEKLAAHLGISFYDKELIQIASKESGFACASLAAGAQACTSIMPGNTSNDSTISTRCLINFLILLPKIIISASLRLHVCPATPSPMKNLNEVIFIIAVQLKLWQCSYELYIGL